jgi:hypothetical protein
MKYDDRIYKYLSSTLNNSDKEKFEKDLEHSNELREQLNSVKLSLNNFVETSKVDINDTLITNNFIALKNSQNSSPRLKFKLSYGLTVFLIVFVSSTIYFFNNESIQSDIDLNLSNIDDSLLINWVSEKNILETESELYDLSITSSEVDIFTEFLSDPNITLTDIELIISEEEIQYLSEKLKINKIL